MNWNMGQTSLPARHQDKQAKTKAFPPDLLLFELPVEVTTPLEVFFSFSFLSNLIKKILHSYFWLASWLITDTTKINSHKQYPRVQVYKLENQSQETALLSPKYALFLIMGCLSTSLHCHTCCRGIHPYLSFCLLIALNKQFYSFSNPRSLTKFTLPSCNISYSSTSSLPLCVLSFISM